VDAGTHIKGGSQGPYICLSVSVWLLNEMALLGERWRGWLVRAKFPMGRLDGTSRSGSVGLLSSLTRPQRSMAECAGAKGGECFYFHDAPSGSLLAAVLRFACVCQSSHTHSEPWSRQALCRWPSA
jgi:hypothetical protein